MIIHRLRAALDALRGVPAGDAPERRHAPVLQVLMLFMLATLPANWAYHLLLVRTPMRRDMGVDLGVDALVWSAAWLALVLVRRGRVRQAVQLFVSAMLLALAIMYVWVGLGRQLLDQTYPVLTIVLGGLILGRRALWLIYALLVAMFCAGGVADVWRLDARHYPRPWLGAANAPSISMSYFVITLVLDRCVAAIRASLDEARRMGGALAAANAALREEMAERERAQERLMHAQKMETVGRLAGGVAHDFNNVLAVIAGYVEQAQAQTALGPMRQAVQGIAAATRRGTAASRKLLSFSRRDSPRPEVFDAAAAVLELEPMLRQLLGNGVALQLELGGAALPVRIDRGQFELALLNIAANARDALAGAGGFRIRVAPARGEGVEVRLADDGPGMSEAVRARIFEPFFTTKPAGSGTGLGLAVVREVVQAAGGEIEVDSRPGAGTAFALRFPRAGTLPAVPAPHRAVRVLLVEDDEDLRELLLAALDDAGCVALAAGTAADAARLLDEAGDSLEVVVSDCRMPGSENGELRWLDGRRRDLAVLLISSFAAAEAERLRRLGFAVACLPKPFAPAALVEGVREAAQRQVRGLAGVC